MNIQYFYKFVQSQFPVKFSKDEIGKTSDKINKKKYTFFVDRDPKLHQRPCFLLLWS